MTLVTRNARRRGWGKSDPEFFVDRQTMGAAVAEVMVNKPEHVESVEQDVIVVVNLERTVQEENCFYAVGPSETKV
jgi:hypothetical protein